MQEALSAPRPEAIEALLAKPDATIDELTEVFAALVVEMAETWELDLDQWLDIVGAWWGHEIDATDFGALFNEMCDGIYSPVQLERRKLLALARRALDSR